jgi:hypothetical protein
MTCQTARQASTPRFPETALGSVLESRESLGRLDAAPTMTATGLAWSGSTVGPSEVPIVNPEANTEDDDLAEYRELLRNTCGGCGLKRLDSAGRCGACGTQKSQHTKPTHNGANAAQLFGIAPHRVTGDESPRSVVRNHSPFLVCRIVAPGSNDFAGLYGLGAARRPVNLGISRCPRRQRPDRRSHQARLRRVDRSHGLPLSPSPLIPNRNRSTSCPSISQPQTPTPTSIEEGCTSPRFERRTGTPANRSTFIFFGPGLTKRGRCRSTNRSSAAITHGWPPGSAPSRRKRWCKRSRRPSPSSSRKRSTLPNIHPPRASSGVHAGHTHCPIRTP